MKIRIYYEDTDAQGIVYHANYLKFCERARSELLLKANIGGFSSNGYFVITKIEANFISSARLADIIQVHTKCIEVGASKIILHQNITLLEKLIFSATIKLAFIKENKPARMDAKMLEFFKSLK